MTSSEELANYVPTSTQELGGLIATRGLYYQWLYALRLIGLVVAEQKYDFFRCEDGSDYLAWKLRPQSNEVSAVRVVQVRHSLSSDCPLRSLTALASVVETFEDVYARRLEQHSLQELRGHIVYNPGTRCIDCNCKELVRLHPSVGRLRDRVRLRNPDCAVLIEPEPFLKLPLSRADVVSELGVLQDQAPELLSFFKTRDHVETLVRDLVGFVAPFYQHLQKATPDQIDPGRPLFDRARIQLELRAAVGKATGRAHDLDQYARRKEAFQSARNRANRQIQTQRWRGQFPSGETTSYLASPEAFREALMKVHFAEGLDASIFWQSPKLGIVQADERFGFRQDRADLIPLHHWLYRTTASHRARLQLIASLASSLSGLSRHGIVLRDFRGADPRFRDLYLVDVVGPPRLVLADLDVLTFDDTEREGLLSSDWVRGSVFAKAMRFIYYGHERAGPHIQSRLFKALWNDNLVARYAEWLDSALPAADVLLADIQDTFRAELHDLPIFVGSVHDDFIRDCANADIEPCWLAIENFATKRLVFDRGRRRPKLFFAIGEDAQIALTFDPSTHAAAERLVLYDRYRWSDNREKDTAAGTPPPAHKAKGITLVVVPPGLDVRTVAQEMFDLNFAEYGEWLRQWQQSAWEKSRGRFLPAILKQELDWLEVQHEIVDQLSARDFAFNTVTEAGSGELTLELTNGAGLRQHLKSTGYHDITGRLELDVHGEDEHGLKFTCATHSVVYDNGLAFVTVSTHNQGRDIPSTGRLAFSDDGRESVLTADASPIRSLRDVQSSASAGSAAPGRAWELLVSVLGEAPLPPRDWNTHADGTESHSLYVARSQDAIEQLRSTLEKHTLAVIVGAPGTGKTRLVADYATLLLDQLEKEQRLHAARIVVVAATHYALDNFTNVFRQRSAGRIVPYRYLPTRSEEDVDPRDELTQESRELSRRHYSDLVARLLGEIKPTAPAGIADAKDVLERHLARLSKRHSVRGAFVPSHQRWRSRMFGEDVSLAPQEADLVRALIKDRLDVLSSSQDFEDEFQTNLASERLNPYAAFACQMLVTTVDAFDRLPDVTCDLLVFEEASQLRLPKMLKAITKATRGRTDGKLPQIIMSGDPRQLPPFVESLPRRESTEALSDAERLHERIEASESPLEAMIRLHRDIVLTMTDQHRMPDAIAELVRTLFYPEQIWSSRGSTAQGRIVWHDTSALTGAFAAPEGTSRYNDGETAVIAKLAHSPSMRGRDILALSPYSAQVKRLAHVLPPNARAQTIDGCQGRQSAVVIVSFVSLRYPTSTDFVVEPRRMNVALSRATEELHLVGSLTDLHDSAAQAIADYPHMTALSRLFARGGRLRNRIKMADT